MSSGISLGSGITFHGKNSIIEDNIIDGSDGRGIHFYPPEDGSLVIINCEISSKGVKTLNEKSVFKGRFELGGDGHMSDCAVHNMPAYPNGPCDCRAGER